MMKKKLLSCLLVFLSAGLQSAAADFETATSAVSNMGLGWNLGNTLDAHSGKAMADVVQSETYWGQPVTRPELMQMMKQAGFGAIRVPVTWYPHMAADGTVDAAWMKRVHEVVDYVISQGLYCILNVHHDTGADSDSHTSWLKADMATYNAQKARYEGLWRQIATEFRDYGERLLFESYNEMLDTYSSWCFASFATSAKYNATVATSAYNAINSYAQSFVDVVRATGGNNAQRNLVVNTYGACSGAGTWNSHLQDPLKQMKLPTDKVQGHLAFQIHAYPDIANLSSAKAEMDGMFTALQTHLVAKGAPVIIGEWGTSDSNADYTSNRANMLSFADYFVKKAKAAGMAPFYWMGLTDGMARSLPAFSQPDLAETLVKACHGSGYQGTFPTEDDFDVTYTVSYSGQWQELNLSSTALNVSDYSGLRVELQQAPPKDYLQVKLYGSTKEGYLPVSGASTAVSFSTAYGTSLSRITLQYCKTASYEAVVRQVVLIKKDGTELIVRPTVFWGCSLSVDARPKTSGIRSVSVGRGTDDGRVYNLAGQPVTTLRRGVYVRGGRKYVVTGTAR